MKALATSRKRTWLIETCEGWFRDYVLPHVQPAARAAVARHKQQGDFTAIVTGATRYAAEPLARELGIDAVVCTSLEIDADGRFTGRPIEPLCYGAGKITLSSRIAELEGFRLAEATFYSDSITIIALLEVLKSPWWSLPTRACAASRAAVTDVERGERQTRRDGS